MRLAITMFVFFVVSLQISFAQTPNENADEQSLRNAESSLLRAENENNKDLFASLLASDFRALTPDGRAFDKSQVLEDTAKRATMHFPYKVEQSGMHFFVFGDTAIAIYTKQFAGTEGEVAVKPENKALSMFSRRMLPFGSCALRKPNPRERLNESHPRGRTDLIIVR